MAETKLRDSKTSYQVRSHKRVRVGVPDVGVSNHTRKQNEELSRYVEVAEKRKNRNILNLLKSVVNK